MLLAIHVKNLALIDEIEVEFEPNLNILSGETGAGKSILIGSVNAALGKKISGDMIRTGAEEALVELFFKSEDPQVAACLSKLEIPLEDDEIVISRRILKNRNISRINGEIVSVQSLKEVTQHLLDIHGQHEHHSLLNRKRHMEILDEFACNMLQSPKDELKQVYEQYIAIKHELEHAVTDEEQRARDQGFIEFEIREIEEAVLVPEEDNELAARYRKMANSRQIMENVSAAHERCGYGANGAGDQLGRAVRELSQVESYDDLLSDLRTQAEELDNLLNDFNRELSAYISDLTFDEQEFRDVETRSDLINHLKSKYGKTIEDILDYYQKRQEELQLLINYDTYLERLRKELLLKEESLKKCTLAISEIRKEQAQILTKKIAAALVDLNFLDVCFEFYFDTLDHYTANGIDDAVFMISTNPGEALRPLNQIASGGELSRIMLAIKSVLADSDAIDTLIFDEIDTGISGRTAQKVAEKLRLIAARHQVICISHLPQIAAMADSHYLIEKGTVGLRTVTSVEKLGEAAIIEEIARLLGGAKITDTVLSSAREMKDLAGNYKNFI